MIEQDMGQDYVLPAHTHRVLQDSEVAFLEALDAHKPQSEFRVGDLAIIHKMPSYLRTRDADLAPCYWQVRMVISLWTYEAWALGNALRLDGRWDEGLRHFDGDVYKMLQHFSSIPSYKAKKAVIYAHGFPHGMWPNTAAWFFDGHLTRDFLRSGNEDWELILDEAHTTYVGLAPEAVMNGISLDLAPDLYGSGEKLQRPFSFEESAFHTLSCFGAEEAAVRGINPKIWSPERTESGHIIL
jgi:hypothetical protein